MTNKQINAAIETVLRRNEYWRMARDYCTNLNAMHKAEQELNANQWHQYALALNEVCWHWALIHAPARQRAEAFLRTLGKWEESK